jgi:3-isopropylmalate dehydrogenase
MRARIVCLPGDGIGPEIMQEAVRVLTSVACAFGHSFTFMEEKLGKAAIQAYGTPLTDKALDMCRSADAVLLGAAGASALDGPSQGIHPEQGISHLKSGLQLYAGIQHCSIPPAPPSASPLRENLAAATDMVLVWPLANNACESFMEEDGQKPVDAVSFTAIQAEQAARLAFLLARERRKSVCCTLLADLDASARLWYETTRRAARDYPDVVLKWLEPNLCAAELVRHPDKFDVLLAGPMLHRPFSGIAAGLTGGPGLAPCAFLGDDKPFVYLPAQGEEASLAGRDMANPIAMILCAAMMLRRSLHLHSEADCVELAVKNVLDSGWRTADMVSGNEPKVGTQAIGKLVAEQVDTAGAVMGAFRG